jgi:hypothetical protein
MSRPKMIATAHWPALRGLEEDGWLMVVKAAQDNSRAISLAK